VLVALRRLAAAAGKGIESLSKNTRTAGTAASAAVEEALADSAVGKALRSLRGKMAAHGLMFATTVSYLLVPLPYDQYAVAYSHLGSETATMMIRFR
jgi:hypothetical protein